MVLYRGPIKGTWSTHAVGAAEGEGWHCVEIVCFASMATGKKGKSLIPDPKSLASEHHMVIVSCLSFLATKSVSPSNPLKVLIIGLGGGSLPRFIDQHLINVRVCMVHLWGLGDIG